MLAFIGFSVFFLYNHRFTLVVVFLAKSKCSWFSREPHDVHLIDDTTADLIKFFSSFIVSYCLYIELWSKASNMGEGYPLFSNKKIGLRHDVFMLR